MLGVVTALSLTPVSVSCKKSPMDSELTFYSDATAFDNITMRYHARNSTIFWDKMTESPQLKPDSAAPPRHLPVFCIA
jgi:hypothetical protein